MAMATRRKRLGMLVAACAAVSAVTTGCSQSSDEIAIDPTTTQSTTTTTEPATTETTPTTIDDEAAVRDVHTRFMTEAGAVGDTRELPREDHLERYNGIAIDPVLTRIDESLQAFETSGQYLDDPGYDSNIVEVEVSSSAASVTDCSRDNGTLYNTDGEILVPADDFFKLRETNLVKIDGQWLVSEFFTGGDVRCEPAE